MLHKREFHEIGDAFLGHAEHGQFSARGAMTHLFPYLYEASKRMSTRAISRWLDESFGIKVSDVTISKALRNPEKHWERFSELIEPSARIVEEYVRPSMGEFLFDGQLFELAISSPDYVCEPEEVKIAELCSSSNLSPRKLVFT